MTAASRMAAMAHDLARKNLPERCDRGYDDPGMFFGRIDFVVAPQMEVGKPAQDRNDFVAIVFHDDVDDRTRPDIHGLLGIADEREFQLAVSRGILTET